MVCIVRAVLCYVQLGLTIVLAFVSHVDILKPEDVGLSPNQQYFRSASEGTPTITYLRLHECPKFSVPYTRVASVFESHLMIQYFLSLRPASSYWILLQICIFCLPGCAVMPLHDHPGMTVFGKILFGSMHVKSYDWVDNPRNSNETTRNANGKALLDLFGFRDVPGL